MDNRIKHSIIQMAETVKGQVLFDLIDLDFKPEEFFKLKFQKQFIDNSKLCRVIFKVNNNAMQRF